MMPLIEKLQQNYPNLYDIDVSGNMALAKEFRLTGTPSFFAVNQGMISQVKLGKVSEDWLRKNLEP